MAGRRISLSLLAGTAKVDRCSPSSIVAIVLLLCLLLALALLKCHQQCAETGLLMALNWIWFLVLSSSYVDPGMVSTQMIFLVNLYLNSFYLTHSTVKKYLYWIYRIFLSTFICCGNAYWWPLKLVHLGRLPGLC